ncbi:MAG: hypothetical protein EOO40_02200, partial [Deltaproteobacteria bacterium]
MPTARLQATLATPTAAACAAGSGALYALGFCGFDQHLLAWLCLAPLLVALDRHATTPRQALGLAWLAGLVAHLGVYTWLIYMLRHFAYLPWALSILGYVLLCLAQSVLFAAFGWLYFVGVRAWGAAGWIWAPVCMVLCEWRVPALFPSYLANSQYRTLQVIQGCELWGVLGLTFLLTLCSAVAAGVVAQLRRRAPWRWQPVAALALLVCGNAAFGSWRLRSLQAEQDAPDGKQVRVGLVQTNMGIYEKQDNPAEGLARHRQQSVELEAQGAQLI